VLGGNPVRIGLVAESTAEVAAAYAANVLDPDGYSLGFVYKSWQP
jgi:hypothetical protein